MKNTNNNELINDCCPVFEPDRWDDKMLDWNKKPFIMATVPAENHVPETSKIQEAVTQMMKLATDANALAPDMLDTLMLFMGPSPSQSNIYLSVTKNVPNANNVTLSGEFKTHVQQGNYENVGHMINQMNADLADHKIAVKNIYAHYAYCPQCEASVGHNYTTLFAEVNTTPQNQMSVGAEAQ